MKLIFSVLVAFCVDGSGIANVQVNFFPSRTSWLLSGAEALGHNVVLADAAVVELGVNGGVSRDHGSVAAGEVGLVVAPGRAAIFAAPSGHWSVFTLSNATALKVNSLINTLVYESFPNLKHYRSWSALEKDGLEVERKRSSFSGIFTQTALHFVLGARAQQLSHLSRPEKKLNLKHVIKPRDKTD